VTPVGLDHEPCVCVRAKPRIIGNSPEKPFTRSSDSNANFTRTSDPTLLQSVSALSPSFYGGFPTADLSHFEKGGERTVMQTLNLFCGKLLALGKREDGQAMAEYGVILALIAVIVVASVAALGVDVKSAFDKIVGAI
jgi:pilus assembly protein Flp/PilA